MDLSLREVARLLQEPEETVYRWVKSGRLPGHRVNDQFRFNRVELQEWAAKHKHPVAPELFGAVNLAAAVARGGVFHHVAGQRREQVLEAVTQLPGIPQGVNRKLLLELLVAREAMASTGLGDGIAIPHPRDPLVMPVDEPRVLVCFLAQPVDFKAIDGQPVRVLFLLLSTSVREHLQLLSKLAYALHDARLRELLQSEAPAQAIQNRLEALEK